MHLTGNALDRTGEVPVPCRDREGTAQQATRRGQPAPSSSRARQLTTWRASTPGIAHAVDPLWLPVLSEQQPNLKARQPPLPCSKYGILHWSRRPCRRQQRRERGGHCCAAATRPGCYTASVAGRHRLGAPAATKGLEVGRCAGALAVSCYSVTAAQHTAGGVRQSAR